MDCAKGFGYLPDIPKAEDYGPHTASVQEIVNKFPKQFAPATATLPSAVDLSPFQPPIEDQGNLGSCTAQSAVALLEYFERKASNGTRHIDGSRLFVYKTTRSLLGWKGDTGAYLRTAMQALVMFGVPPESYAPYNISKFDDEPSTFVYALASNYKATQYFRLDPVGTSRDQVLVNIKTYVNAKFPCMFGFPVYTNYDRANATDNKVSYPKSSDVYRGGHANVVVGYDDSIDFGNGEKGALLVRNSWGTSWGRNGYGYLSYKFVTSGLANDFWTLISADWINTTFFQ